VDWFIPFTSELIPCCAIPPGVVETSVGETGYFCKDIQDAFEDDVEF
jgi:hypothetical protein